MPVLSATRKATTLSPPLPVSNAAFAQAGIAFRRKQFSIVAAAPGVGKTLLATNLSIRTPVPTLYFSADSDEWTVKQRACSILSGTPLSAVEQQLNDETWDAYYTDKLRAADHVDWCFQPDIEVEFIVERLFAHAELRGEFPQLIIVDNIGNTVVDQDNESAELRAACREMQRIARTTGAHVMALAHVKGAKENGNLPINLGDLLYNIGKIPEVVLGLHREQGETYTVTVPKQRGGKAGMSVPVGVDYNTAIVGGFRAVSA
jgi:hypothetical protein